VDRAEGLVAHTARLAIRRLRLEDAPFILELVNDPDWLRFIGDKNVHSLEEARGYLENGPLAMYARHGFGLYAVERGGTPLGLCGLIKRDTLEDVDLGFAFLPAARGAGHAREASAAMLAHARTDFGLQRLVAITSLDNTRSAAVLEAVGFHFERQLRLSARDEVRLFGIALTR
jgi:RimJ/RimL family protein N-acetyltransferase